MPNHGNQRFTSWQRRANHLLNIEVGALGDAGPAVAGRSRLLDVLGVPSDARGIVLLCGYIAAAAFGLFAVLTPPGDLIGWGYIALAIVGYWFIPTRGLTTFLWLLVATGGAAVATSGSIAGWIGCGIGIALALVGLSPTRRPRQTTNQLLAETTIANPAPAPNDLIESEELTHSEPHNGSETVEESLPPDVGLFIRTLGQFRLLACGSDLTSGLESKPTLAFLFKLLLSQWVLDRPEVQRDRLADDFSPHVPQASQRQRLRKQLHKLQHTTPLEIGDLVRTSPTHVWLELDDVDSDVAELRRLSETVKQRASLLDAALAREVRKVLNRTDGLFLHGFEDLEQRVNQGAGSAGQIVAEARTQIANLRADLVIALAEYEDGMGHPGTAIEPLAAALDDAPDRQDVARLLVVAYLKTGQTTRASQVRRQFGLKQE